MNKQNRDDDTMEIERSTALATIGREQRVNHDFADRVCTDRTTFMRSQASSYRTRLNAVVGDAKAR